MNTLKSSTLRISTNNAKILELLKTHKQTLLKPLYLNLDEGQKAEILMEMLNESQRTELLFKALEP